MHENEADLYDAILSYLSENRDAMDTLDGIAEWWVLRQQIDIEVRRVARALDALVSEGLIEEYEQGGIRFYRRPRPAASFNAAAKGA